MTNTTDMISADMFYQYSLLKSRCLKLIEMFYTDVDILLKVSRVPMLGYDPDIASKIITCYEENPTDFKHSIFNKDLLKNNEDYEEFVDIMHRMRDSDQIYLYFTGRSMGADVSSFDKMPVSEKYAKKSAGFQEVYNAVKEIIIDIIAGTNDTKHLFIINIINDNLFATDIDILIAISKIDNTTYDLVIKDYEYKEIVKSIDFYQKITLSCFRYNHLLNTNADESEIKKIETYTVKTMLDAVLYSDSLENISPTDIAELALIPFKSNLGEIFSHNIFHHIALAILMLAMKERHLTEHIEITLFVNSLTEILVIAMNRFKAKSAEEQKNAEEKFFIDLQSRYENIIDNIVSCFQYHNPTYTFVDVLDLIESITSNTYSDAVRLFLENIEL